MGSRKLRRKVDARLGVGALVKRQEALLVAHEMQRGLSYITYQSLFWRGKSRRAPRCSAVCFAAPPARITAFEVGARLGSTPKKVITKNPSPQPSRAPRARVALRQKNLPHSQGAEPPGPGPCFPPNIIYVRAA